MATDKILVERQTDGEKCCGECLWFANEPKEYCCLFDQPLGDDYLQRCPACLATPSARVLTPEMLEAVEGVICLFQGMELRGKVQHQDDVEVIARFRAAFGIEEGK